MKPVSFLPVATMVIFVLVVVGCLISVFNNDIYQDGPWANAQWLGQDIVSLILGAPMLLISFHYGIRRGALPWHMVYSGVLFYFLYTYTFYVFEAELTFLYFFQIPVFGLAAVGLVTSLIPLFAGNREINCKSNPIRWMVILYLFLIALMISFIWLTDIFAHLTDSAHHSSTPDGKAPLIIYSLDLGIVIPLMIAAAFLVARKKKSGFILTGIMLAKTSLLGFALMAMGLSMAIQELNPELFLAILWCIIGTLGTLLTVWYLKNITSLPM